MTTRYLVFLSAAMASAVTALANSSILGVVCAGAARLDNGSIVTLGQPFVGMMSAPGGGLVLGLGIIPALSVSTNPPPPTVGQPRMEGGTFAFRFAGQPGRSYEVWASTNLEDWVVIRTITATEASQPFTDPDAANFNRRFYKVQAP
jgi:hypothetical protein